jgi:AcrR family transcriptional regulator
MSKGAMTKAAIVDVAKDLASRVGLGGLTIGGLADEIEMSKSGLFAHFRSKETLQLEVLEASGAAFIETVFKPAIAKARGEPRVRALFEGLLAWDRDSPGGCIFIAAASELDDQVGAPREMLVENQRGLLAALAKAARIAVEEGHFRADLDPEQFAFEMHLAVLGYHHASRLLRDPRAEKRARRAFEALLERTRRKRKARKGA